MHEQDQDKLFTPDMRSRLAQEFNLRQTPKVIADDASRFVVSLPVPDVSINDNGAQKESIKFILGQRLFISRFIEEYFSDNIQGNMKQQARNFAIKFYNWKNKSLDTYEGRNDPDSKTAARIMNRITLKKVHDFTETEFVKYRSYEHILDKNSTLYVDSSENSQKWQQYEKVARFALYWDRLQPSLPKK